MKIKFIAVCLPSYSSAWQIFGLSSLYVLSFAKALEPSTGHVSAAGQMQSESHSLERNVTYQKKQHMYYSWGSDTGQEILVNVCFPFLKT